jgi:hypothetical protein
MVCSLRATAWLRGTDITLRPVENGSVTGPLFKVAEYTIQVIKKMQRDHIKSWVPRQDITDRFNEHAQEWIKHTVWKSDCRSWYKNNETGRVNGMFNLLW